MEKGRRCQVRHKQHEQIVERVLEQFGKLDEASWFTAEKFRELAQVVERVKMELEAKRNYRRSAVLLVLVIVAATLI